MKKFVYFVKYIFLLIINCFLYCLFLSELSVNFLKIMWKEFYIIIFYCENLLKKLRNFELKNENNWVFHKIWFWVKW